MKKLISASLTLLSLLFLFFVMQTNITSAKQDSKPEIFTPNDTKMCNIELDMTKDKIEKILGQPNKIEKHYEDAFGGDVLVYYYNFGYIRLEPLGKAQYTVAEIVIDKPGFEGPRGIKVDDKIEGVLSKFPNNGVSLKYGEKWERRYLYGSDTEENCGYIEFTEEGRIGWIIFNYGQGFGSYGLGIEVKDGKVKSVGVSVTNV